MFECKEFKSPKFNKYTAEVEFYIGKSLLKKACSSCAQPVRGYRLASYSEAVLSPITNTVTFPASVFIEISKKRIKKQINERLRLFMKILKFVVY